MELEAIPRSAGGVYVVLRPDAALEPGFLERSPAGTFRGDPTVNRSALEANWVSDAAMVYIGKADHSRLRIRLQEYVSFGRGGMKRHYGGRLIWQLAEAQGLLVAWRAMPESDSPREAERLLLAAFRSAYQQPPFANDPQRLGR